MLRELGDRAFEGIDLGRRSANENESDVAQTAASGGLRLYPPTAPSQLCKGDAAHSTAGGLGEAVKKLKIDYFRR